MNTIIKIYKTALLIVLFSLGNAGNLLAQDSGTATTKDWSFIIEPYMMFPNMTGSIGLGNLPEATIDGSSNDILGQLKMGFMLNAEATNGKWTIGSDFLYMDLAQGVKDRNLVKSGEVSAKQLGWEAAGMYKVQPWLDLGIGGIVNSVNAGADLNVIALGGGTTAKSKSLTKTWFDPMLIARINSNEVNKFIYQFRTEVGGFGIGSDFAWNMQAYAGYRFSQLFQVSAGYRIISLDFESGSGENQFVYNVDTSGAVIRLGFNL